MTFEFGCVIICNMKTSLVPYGNPEDSIKGYNFKTFSSNKAVLLDFVRQIFKNRENEYLTLEEIKDCLETGKYLDLYANYIFEEKNWKRILEDTIILLFDMGYGIETRNGKYVYDSKFDRLLNSMDYNNALSMSNCLSEIEDYIKSEKNIFYSIRNDDYYKILKKYGDIIKNSKDSKTKCWSKELYDQIDKSSFVNEDKEIIEFLNDALIKFDKKPFDTHSLSCIYCKIEEFLFERYTKFDIMTPYVIIDNFLIGGRLSKDLTKAYPIVIVPIESILLVNKFTYQAKNKTRTKIHNLPFSQIENLFIEHYGEEFRNLTMDEKLQKVYYDKLWEYNKYHVRYKFLDNRSVANEIKTKFKLIKETKDRKGYYSAYFNHNNKEEVFEFVQDNQSGIMKFTTDDIQNEYSQWVKNNRNKKRIDN